MHNLEVPSSHQLSVPNPLDRQRPKTPSGYDSRSPYRSPRGQQQPNSSNFLTVIDNPVYEKQMSSLRSTISSFNTSQFNPNSWKNRPKKGNNDALFKSRAEDPLFKSGKITSLNRTTFQHSTKVTDETLRDKKPEGLSYNNIMQKIDKKQKLINQLKELSKFDAKSRVKSNMEGSYGENQPGDSVESPMRKRKDPLQLQTYPRKEYPTSCTFIDTTYTPTKSSKRGNFEKDSSYQRASEKDTIEKKDSLRVGGEKRFNNFNPFNKSPTNISSPNGSKPLSKADDLPKTASPVASNTLNVPSQGEKRITTSLSSRELVSPTGSPSTLRKTDKEKPRDEVVKLSVNDFYLGKGLGEGKFGAVFQAVHKETGWLFALKKIPKKMIKEHYMQDQFLLEVKIQSFCDHQNILKIYGCFDDKEYIYLVLEYMQEGTLFGQMKKSKTLSEEQTARKVKDVTLAIKYLHDEGIAHRDIKPQNIVLSNQVGKLCDFGWAAICNERRKTYCGTFDYAAPQILEGVEYDYTVDLWCIGVLAYELLVGKAPFYHISRKQTMKKIMNVESNSIEFPTTVSKQAVSFIENLVRKNPEQRMVAQNMLKHPFLTQLDRPNPS